MMRFRPQDQTGAAARRRLAVLMSGALWTVLAGGPARAEPVAPAPVMRIAAVSAAPLEEEMTAPPVVDPKNVETETVAPSAPSDFKPLQTTLDAMPVLILAGAANWDDAYDRLVSAFRTLEEERERLGLKRAGAQVVVYLSSDERGFEFEAQLPFAGATNEKPANNVRLGASHAGRVFVFQHAGSFADMDNTYEMIANYLDEKNVDANDLYMERYRTDLVTGRPEALEIEVLVPAP